MAPLKPSLDRRVAVIGAPVLKAHSRFNEALLRYAAQRGNWRFVFSMEASVEALRFLRQLKCDGALVRIVSREMAQEARRARVPLVNFSSWLQDPGVPTVRDDAAAKGCLCAEHLLGKGFRRFGLVMPPAAWLFTERRDGFLRTIQAAGFGANVSMLALRSQQPVNESDLRRFRRWLLSLPVPVGLFLVDDLDAPALMNACRQVGRRIPQDVAVVAGLGHEEVLPFCDPPLSHVRGNDEAVALQAAQYLDRLMSGSHEGGTIIMPVQGLVAQTSTETVAVDDPLVARAVEFIRARAGEAMNIKALVNELDVSRRTLDRRFCEVMRTSVHHFLTRERVERARDLLRAQPPLSLKEVARRCGFADARRLNEVFRKVTGQTLAEARARAGSK